LLFAFFSVTINAQSTKILGELDGKHPEETKKAAAPKTATVAGSAATFDLKAHTDSMTQLLKKSDDLTTMAQKLRSDAKQKSESVKTLLVSEASNLEKQSQLVQIRASEISAEISNYKFNKNRATIKTYVAKTGEENVPVYAKNLIFDSEKIIRLAKEMREEANAQPNLASKLGTMGNAEEQEQMALNKQVEALTILEKDSKSTISAQH
jgi:hypothetical protein